MTGMTLAHYLIVEHGTISPVGVADGKALRSGWRSTVTAALNFGEQNICPVMTGDRKAGC